MGLINSIYSNKSLKFGIVAASSVERLSSFGFHLVFIGTLFDLHSVSTRSPLGLHSFSIESPHNVKHSKIHLNFKPLSVFRGMEADLKRTDLFKGEQLAVPSVEEPVLEPTSFNTRTSRTIRTVRTVLLTDNRCACRG